VYLTLGVNGNDLGFWITTDGGQNWVMPDAFPPSGATTDVTTMVVDPSDYKHLLIGSHGFWSGDKTGLLESTDGGSTWLKTPQVFPPGSLGIGFLYDPRACIGDSKTWVVIADGTQRTTDSGATWTKVSDLGGVHGGAEIYRAHDGVVYAGGGHPKRSTDNGLTWQELTQGLPNSAYYSIVGDGKNLYVLPENSQILTSSEDDGINWAPYPGSPTIRRSALKLRFDPKNRIVYLAAWDAGLWALKVPE
jgi:photosystem II stability/assembly factor-like uncharacterized protein